tara:strand:+ start:25850 stop:26992 length:1143 start_codon:yes stop_codon:yes gene_type:complete
MKKLGISLIAIMIFIPKLFAQNEPNPVTTAAPFLLIVPDARAGGMGDVGVATSADENSQHHNPSQYAFLESQYTLGINYTPWMRELVNDVFLGGVTFANRINERSAWAASMKYFTLGEIQLTDIEGNPLGIEKPNEFSLDGTYALKLNETFSMGVTMRYIRSDFALKVDNSILNTVNTFSVDISGYYQSIPKKYENFDGRWRGGFNFSNLGPKVTYSDGGKENFIPSNMKLGGGFDFILNDLNTISTTVEFTKLLVPSPPLRDGQGNIIEGKDDDVPFFTGVFQSFGDAPDGFGEEMKEFTWGIGAEYIYANTFALRTGYFHESEFKGARQFVTMGLGFKFKSSRMDISYLFNSSEVNNPLENTLRFSLAFDFGDLYKIN